MLSPNLINMTSLYALFANQVEINGNKLALIHNNNSFTYRELNSEVDIVISYLVSNNIFPHTRIAIFMSPSVTFVATVLACLKLGISYIPLSLSSPDIYLKKILHDAEVSSIIIEQSQKERPLCQEMTTIIINGQNNQNTNITSYFIENNLDLNTEAYVIYTSGSTGTPKGVPITHKNILNLLRATSEIYKIGEKDKIPLFHSISFDFSVWELFSALFNGACLVITPEDTKTNLESYIDFILTYSISIINMTPSIFYRFVDLIKKITKVESKNFNIRLVILGGEALQYNKLISWYATSLSKNVEIFNMYGITEATIHSTSIRINKNLIKSANSLIGQTLDGVESIILNELGKTVLYDEIGELYLGGDSITNGYLNAPELNLVKFIYRSFDGYKSKRWFKTGDLVKKNKDEDLEYISRCDEQVKIRGFRINCKEIEQFLSSIELIKNALVTTYDIGNGDKRLVAFLEGDKDLINIDFVKQKFKENLPDFMLPSKFLLLKELPYNINGKKDADKLIAMMKTSNEVADFSKNLISLEQKISHAWKKTLNVSDVRVDVTFFDAGGDSLLLFKLQYELESIFHTTYELMDIIKFPTIKLFSLFLQEGDEHD